MTLLASAQVAPALEVGANDDTSKHMDDRGAALFAEMRALGLTRVVIGVRYTPSAAMTIADKPLLDEVVPRAVEAGLKVVLAVYPYPPREIEAGIGTPLLFGSYVKALARAYPQVREVIVGNEPNQPAFWRPQFDAQGRNVSAAAFGAYLAAAYDALKSVDSEIVVVGVGLSPRGNDKPSARNNVSTSPVRFLRALGAWYRASGRTRPLMDAFSFHPYPARATDPLERGYSWPNAGFVNLDRVKQALWDAFHGTAQRTPANGLKLHLDEVGWQVDTSTRSGYAGWENVPVTDELTQAAIYGELVRRAACDPGIASLSFFGFRDDGLRTGFQAGLQWVDGVPRAAAEAVRVALAETADGCKGTPVSWRPERRVQGARVDVRASPRRVRARIAAGEDARAVVCARPWRPGASRRCREVAVPGLRSVTVALPLPQSGRRGVAVEVELVAEANAARRVRVVERPRV
ncbi:MAG: hypothetical protein NZL88_01435 [Gaiellaceae bacterium]|nr:hypothetical protein [Gaiellaceae bacterium]